MSKRCVLRNISAYLALSSKSERQKLLHLQRSIFELSRVEPVISYFLRLLFLNNFLSTLFHKTNCSCSEMQSWQLAAGMNTWGRK